MKNSFLRIALTLSILLSFARPANGQHGFYSSVEIGSSLIFSPKNQQHFLEGTYQIRYRSYLAKSCASEIFAGLGGIARGYSPILENHNPNVIDIEAPAYVQEYRGVVNLGGRVVFEDLRKLRKYVYPYIGVSFQFPFPQSKHPTYTIFYTDGDTSTDEMRFNNSSFFLDIGAQIVLKNIPDLTVGFSFDFLQLPSNSNRGISRPSVDPEGAYVVCRRPAMFKLTVGILIPHSRKSVEFD